MHLRKINTHFGIKERNINNMIQLYDNNNRSIRDICRAYIYGTSLAFYREHVTIRTKGLIPWRLKSSKKLLHKTRDLAARRHTWQQLLLNFKSRWRSSPLLRKRLAQKEASVAAVTQTSVECSQPC